MKTKEEQRFDLVCAALSGLCANAHPGVPASEYGKSAVSFADAVMKELEATVNESLTVDLDAMLAACIPGGDACDPQEVADAIREWYANHIVDANKKVPDLLEIPWSCTKCGNETRNKHGYCDSCTKGKVPGADGWIPHRPGDSMPCGKSMLVDIQFPDGEIHRRVDPLDYDWGIHPLEPQFNIVKWRPAQ